MNTVLSMDDCFAHLRNIEANFDQKAEISLGSAEFQARAFESLPLPAWIKDVEGVMRFVNHAYEKIYDISAKRYVGARDVDIWPTEVAEKFSAMDDKVLAGQNVEYCVEKIPNRVGFRAYDHVHVVKYPIYNGPEVVGIAGIVTGVFP